MNMLYNLTDSGVWVSTHPPNRPLTEDDERKMMTLYLSCILIQYKLTLSITYTEYQSYHVFSFTEWQDI